MGAIEHLTISLSAEKAEKVRARIASGEYSDESAVFEEALAALEAMDEDAHQWLRAEVAAACDELDRDPSSGIPIEQVVARLKAERLTRGE